MARLTLLAAVVLGACLVLTTNAHAEPDVRIASLDCDSNPETVIIHNLGDETQSVTGATPRRPTGSRELLLYGCLPTRGTSETRNTLLALAQRQANRERRNDLRCPRSGE